MRKTDSDNRFGTSYRGRFIMPYELLIHALGSPHWSYMDDDNAVEDKVDVEWVFKFDDGDIVTIYNWKNGKAYLGEEGLHPEEITEWHVGGHDNTVVYRLSEYMNNVLEGMNDNEQ